MGGIFTIVIVVFLTLAVAILGYIAFSSAISLDYARKEQEHLRQREYVLQSLLLETSNHMSRNQLVALVKENFGTDHIVKEENNQITIDNTVLKFEGERVKSISSINDDF